MQGEAVVGGDEVDAGGGIAVVALVEIGTAGEPFGEFAEDAVRTAPVVAHAIAVAAIPFRPSGWELADLVTVLPHVPGFGDKLDPADHGVLVDDAEEGAEA